MADAPRPITSPPAQGWQPYDANEPGTEDDTATPDVYGANSPEGDGQWPKIQDGGAASWSTGKITGGWTSDGTSNGGAWKQT